MSGDIELQIFAEDLGARFLMSPNELHRGDGPYAGLSLDERGLLAALLTMRNGYRTSRSRIDKIAEPQGKDAVDRMIRNLKTRGFLATRKDRGERGRFVWVWSVFMTPRDVSAGGTIPGSATHGPPVDGPPVDGQSGYIRSTKGSEDQGSEEDQEPPLPPAEPTPHAAGAAEPETGGDSSQKHTEDKPHGVDALVADLVGLAPSWKPAATRDVLLELAKRNAHPLPEIERVMRAAAAGELGPTGSPRRLLSWWPTAPTAAPEPAWARGPVTYLPAGTPPCGRHQGEPARGCGRCKAEKFGADVDVPPAPHAAEAAGLSGPALAREIARRTRTAAAPRRTPEPPGEPAGPGETPPGALGALPGTLAEALS